MWKGSKRQATSVLAFLANGSAALQSNLKNPRQASQEPTSGPARRQNSAGVKNLVSQSKAEAPLR
jgi:hypothetical protein